jgi:hypothetical protein
MKTQKQAWDKNKAGEALVLARRNFSLCRRCCHCCRLEGIAPEVEVDFGLELFMLKQHLQRIARAIESAFCASHGLKKR